MPANKREPGQVYEITRKESEEIIRVQVIEVVGQRSRVLVVEHPDGDFMNQEQIFGPGNWKSWTLKS